MCMSKQKPGDWLFSFNPSMSSTQVTMKFLKLRNDLVDDPYTQVLMTVCVKQTSRSRQATFLGKTDSAYDSMGRPYTAKWILQNLSSLKEAK
mmetsp:Transcript_3567/g.5428  ORF Transcript_3567/g.5428 Transcript_3567/m.5428 type:complete len:92 (+) Transcript_3567:623-898(+)